MGRIASYSELWFASQGGPRYWLQLREIPEEQYVQSTEWSLSTVCLPFPAGTLPSYLADQGTSGAEIILTPSMRTQRKLCRFVANLCAS